MMKILKILFIVSVFALLVAPLCYINTSEIAEQENRILKKFPDITKNGNLNYDFGKDFETWLGDRFWGRDILINAHWQALYKINGKVENEKAFVGDDGWMFEKSETVNIKPLRQQRKKIDKNIEIFKKFIEKFQGKNIPIYLVVLPDREQIYVKFWEKYYKPKPKLDYGEEIERQLKGISGVKVIYPKKEFEKKADSIQLFEKNDPHLTGEGLALFINEIQKAIMSDLNVNTFDFSLVKRIRPYKAHIANLLGLQLTGSRYAVMPVITSHVVHGNVVQSGNKFGDYILLEYYTKNTIDKSLFFIGGCNMRYSQYFWRELFVKSVFLRINNQEQDKVFFHLKEHKFSPNEIIVMIYSPNSNSLTSNLEKVLELPDFPREK